MTVTEKSKAVLRALSKLEKDSNLSINELRVVLALERLIARIDRNKILRKKLIYKGGFVLLKTLDSQRFTRDLDALASDISKQVLITQLQTTLKLDLDDGLYYASPAIEDLIDQGDYGGYRIKIPFQIGPIPTDLNKIKKLSRIHLDIGIGDVIYGKAKQAKLISTIGIEKPISWKIYPIESIYAEKLETLVSRGSANSRAKDLFDLVMLHEELQSSTKLVSAIKKTFSNRKTEIPTSFASFFKGLDLTILERSWGSVELAVKNMTFSNCKDKLGSILKDLDRVFTQTKTK